MFNRKKIENLKANLKMINEERLQLRGENIVYQKELMFLRDIIMQNNDMLNQLIAKNTKKRTNNKKNEKQEMKKVVKKEEKVEKKVVKRGRKKKDEQ